MQDVDGVRKRLKYSIQRQRKPDRDFIEKNNYHHYQHLPFINVHR